MTIADPVPTKTSMSDKANPNLRSARILKAGFLKIRRLPMLKVDIVGLLRSRFNIVRVTNSAVNILDMIPIIV